MKFLVRLVVLAALGAVAAAAVRALRREGDPLPAPATAPNAPWPPLRPEPATAPESNVGAPSPAAAPVAAEPSSPEPKASADDAWAEPDDDECPPGFPLKANMKSKIFHSPGQLNYDRTTPDRCYASAEAAEADGLRAAKR